MFAIAFTILVLDLQVPDGLSPDQLRAALRDQLPQLFSAGLSFAVIGRFWIGHHAMFDRVHAADRGLLALNTLLLVPIALIPFSTSLLAEYGSEAIAVIVYAVTVGAAGAGQLAVWLRAARLQPDSDPLEVVRRSFGIAGAVLAFGISIPVALVSPRAALLCWLGTLVPTGALADSWYARRRR